jgi:hypothetical protein
MSTGSKREALILIVGFVLSSFVCAAAETPQRKPAPAKKKPAAAPSKVAAAKADVARAAADYKASLEKLLALQQAELKAAEEMLAKKKALPPEIISRSEIEKEEYIVLQTKAKVDDTRRDISGASDMIAEAEAATQLERMPRLKTGGYYSSVALIRYAGTSAWLLSNATQVETFFNSTFKQALPVSAFGQTPVHDKLGFDHRNSLDVALHPDSAEGQALMTYLRGAGIPFIAFRHAVPGAATGAHIHIGYPSKRLH